MKDRIQIKKMANGFLVNFRTDSVVDKETYVFETIDGLISFIKKNFEEVKKK